MGVHRLSKEGPPPVHILGVDVDTKAAHIATLNTQTGCHQVNSAIWPVGDFSDGRRLIEARAHVRRFAETLHEHFPVMACAIELPVGRFPKPSLTMTAGVVCEAIGAAIGVAPFFLPTGDWRKRCGLAGNCSKDEVMAWARSHGWEGTRHDHAEALGVAVAAAGVWGVELPGLRQIHRRAA